MILDRLPRKSGNCRLPGADRMTWNRGINTAEEPISSDVKFGACDFFMLFLRWQAYALVILRPFSPDTSLPWLALSRHAASLKRREWLSDWNNMEQLLVERRRSGVANFPVGHFACRHWAQAFSLAIGAASLEAVWGGQHFQ